MGEGCGCHGGQNFQTWNIRIEKHNIIGFAQRAKRMGNFEEIALALI